MRLIGLNADPVRTAHKHRALPVVGDAREGLAELDDALGDWQSPEAWRRRGEEAYAAWNATVAEAHRPTNRQVPTYAHVIGPRINRKAGRRPTRWSTAAGGLPGELTKNWKVKTVGTFDCRVRLQLHGLRDRRRLGHQRWPGPSAR